MRISVWTASDEAAKWHASSHCRFHEHTSGFTGAVTLPTYLHEELNPLLASIEEDATNAEISHVLITGSCGL